jgi:hypothetical protein
MVEFISKQLDDNCDVSALYVDVANAFDSVNYNILLYKLNAYGFRGIINDWFSSYLNGRFQYVEMHGQKSMLRLQRSGVPQGSVLGGLLFLFYINDLANIDPDSHFILFADDTTCLVYPNEAQDNYV